MRIREKLPDDTSKRLAGFLYTLSSFFAGVARLFDFWGLFSSYDTDSSGRMADAKALNADWRAIGSDIDWAISNYRHTEPLRK
jgi:hypothetical protein